MASRTVASSSVWKGVMPTPTLEGTRRTYRRRRPTVRRVGSPPGGCDGSAWKGLALASQQVVPQLHFEAPGPDSWALDAVHFPRPVTRYWTEMHPEPFKRGFSEFT